MSDLRDADLHGALAVATELAKGRLDGPESKGCPCIGEIAVE